MTECQGKFFHYMWWDLTVLDPLPHFRIFPQDVLHIRGVAPAMQALPVPSRNALQVPVGPGPPSEDMFIYTGWCFTQPSHYVFHSRVVYAVEVCNVRAPNRCFLQPRPLYSPLDDRCHVRPLRLNMNRSHGHWPWPWPWPLAPGHGP